jgi:hypothetical protein
VDVNNQPKYDEKENAIVRNLQTKQRRLERAVVKNKKSKMISEELWDTKSAKFYDRKVRGLQGKLRELVDSNEHLTRDYNREKVYTPIDTLIQTFNYEKK